MKNKMLLRRWLITACLFSLAVLQFGCGVSSGRQIVQVTALPSPTVAATLSAEQATPTFTPPSTTTPTSTPDPAALTTATATPTPWQVTLTEGEARAIAAATDVALKPTPRSRISFNAYPVPITFAEFYDGYNMRTGLILSDKLVSLDEQTVVMEGYIAPPLKADLDFFVLTRIRLAVCPFCSTNADWPDDIAMVYMPEGEALTSTQYPVRITGRMEVGTSMDFESGMVSLVRIYADEVEVLQ